MWFARLSPTEPQAINVENKNTNPSRNSPRRVWKGRWRGERRELAIPMLCPTSPFAWNWFVPAPLPFKTCPILKAGEHIPTGSGSVVLQNVSGSGRTARDPDTRRTAIISICNRVMAAHYWQHTLIALSAIFISK
ncbi:unnamed protein product [Nezara viridula]|uniref:Uncharacterized protein n=1 Tax=Nezara viridula TaxID=85310 RepID=A0A9P0E255_NEZVI|nr:unnamed protein product [Nezara viridula]